MLEHVAGSSTHKPNAMHVACVADARYGPYAGISLASVLASTPEADIHMHVFSDRIRERDITRLDEMARLKRASLSVYDVARMLDGYECFAVGAHYSRACYGRLFMGDLLPPTIQSVIYLDCDVICVDSLADLWARKDDVSIVGAVRDVWVDRDQEHKRKIGINERDPYYNSGVLLINLDAWREKKISESLLAFIAANPRNTYVDQDAINAVLGKEIVELSGRWNVLISSPDRDKLASQLENAANIHFCASLKPWHFGYTLLGGMSGAAFRRAKAGSPWRWMMPDLQLRRIARKLGMS